MSKFVHWLQRYWSLVLALVLLALTVPGLFLAFIAIIVGGQAWVEPWVVILCVLGILLLVLRRRYRI